jgi:hypothetical protein
VTRLSWTGADIIPFGVHVLELNKPEDGVIRVAVSVPSGALRASFVVDHLSPARISLPFQGGTKVKITVEGDEFEWTRRLSISRELNEVTLPERMLVGRDSLTVEIRLAGSTALYWLAGFEVRFDR